MLIRVKNIAGYVQKEVTAALDVQKVVLDKVHTREKNITNKLYGLERKKLLTEIRKYKQQRVRDKAAIKLIYAEDKYYQELGATAHDKLDPITMDIVRSVQKVKTLLQELAGNSLNLNDKKEKVRALRTPKESFLSDRKLLEG